MFTEAERTEDQYKPDHSWISGNHSRKQWKAESIDGKEPRLYEISSEYQSKSNEGVVKGGIITSIIKGIIDIEIDLVNVQW